MYQIIIHLCYISKNLIFLNQIVLVNQVFSYNGNLIIFNYLHMMQIN